MFKILNKCYNTEYKKKQSKIYKCNVTIPRSSLTCKELAQIMDSWLRTRTHSVIIWEYGLLHLFARVSLILV